MEEKDKERKTRKRRTIEVEEEDQDQDQDQEDQEEEGEGDEWLRHNAFATQLLERHHWERLFSHSFKRAFHIFKCRCSRNAEMQRCVVM